jgi:predicted transposase YbfD/YdcC
MAFCEGHAMSDLISFFTAVEDPRARNVRHRLSDLLVIMVAASLCGATNATEMALFAEERREALSRLITYEEAPSHDTFSRVLRLVAPDGFAGLLARLAHRIGAGIADEGGPAVVALDGKALKRAYDRGQAACPPLTVTAFAAATRLCLAASLPGTARNEVEAALEVVDLLDLTGQTVTADALHCHHRMAEAVIRRGGDYLLAVKANRPDWLKAAKTHFAGVDTPDLEQHERGHDREERRALVLRPAARPVTTGHTTFLKLMASRNGGRPSTRYYIASGRIDASAAMAAIRAHWRIENSLHWVLDVHLNEDRQRGRRDHAPANLAALARLARNVLQACDKPKVPISHRIRKCAWNDTYLINAFSHMR